MIAKLHSLIGCCKFICCKSRSLTSAYNTLASRNQLSKNEMKMESFEKELAHNFASHRESRSQDPILRKAPLLETDACGSTCVYFKKVICHIRMRDISEEFAAQDADWVARKQCDVG